MIFISHQEPHDLDHTLIYIGTLWRTKPQRTLHPLGTSKWCLGWKDKPSPSIHDLEQNERYADFKQTTTFAYLQGQQPCLPRMMMAEFTVQYSACSRQNPVS